MQWVSDRPPWLLSREKEPCSSLFLSHQSQLPSASPQQPITGNRHTKSLPWMTHHCLPPSLGLALQRKGTALLDLTLKGLAWEHNRAMQDLLFQRTPIVG